MKWVLLAVLLAAFLVLAVVAGALWLLGLLVAVTWALLAAVFEDPGAAGIVALAVGIVIGLVLRARRREG